MAHAVGPRDIRLRLARSKPLKRLLALVGTQLRRTAKFHATGLRTLPALTCTSADKITLKLGNAAAVPVTKPAPATTGRLYVGAWRKLLAWRRNSRPLKALKRLWNFS